MPEGGDGSPEIGAAGVSVVAGEDGIVNLDRARAGGVVYPTAPPNPLVARVTVPTADPVVGDGAVVDGHRAPGDVQAAPVRAQANGHVGASFFPIDEEKTAN